MSNTATYPVIVSEINQTFPIGISISDETYSVKMEDAIQIIDADTYQGDYVVTPASEAIVLNTLGFTMADNVTLEAIPNNYGLITWNGSYLTVS